MRVRPIRVLFVVPNLFFGGAERGVPLSKGGSGA